MSSSWPIVIGVAFMGAAAAWYDAKNETLAPIDAANVHDVEPPGASTDLAGAEASEDKPTQVTNADSRALAGTSQR